MCLFWTLQWWWHFRLFGSHEKACEICNDECFSTFWAVCGCNRNLNNCFSLISSAVSSQFCMLVNSVVFISHSYLFSCLDLCSMGKVKLSNSTSIALLPSSPDNYRAVLLWHRLVFQGKISDISKWAKSFPLAFS